MDPNNIPFKTLIVGPTSSSKTQYLVNQLRGPFRGKLDHMVLIRPTFVHNKTYDSDSRMFAIDCPKEEVEEYKELMAKTCAIHLESNFLININRMSEQKALNEVMQMLEATPDSSKPSDFPVLLPANNVPGQREKLAVLVSAGNSKEALRAQLSHEQLKRLSDKEVEKIYKWYKAYVGSNTTETLTQSFFMLASKVIGMLVKVNDVEVLQKGPARRFRY